MAVIEATIIAYLTEHDDVSYPVYGDTPPGDTPSSYHLVQKTGNSAHDHLHTAQIVIQSVTTESKLTAAAMNETVVSAMADFAASESSVSACRLNSDYDFTDTTTKRYRYQAVFDVTYTREV